jgi:hypothetical protein
MKNTQKGSVTIWIVLVTVLVAIVGGGLYIFNSDPVCRITDSSGKTTTGPCPENNTDYSINTNDQTDLGRVQNAINRQIEKYQKNPPVGFLIPTKIPSGYKVQASGHLFESDRTHFYFSTGKGVSADPQLWFEEGSSIYPTLTAYLESKAKDPNSKIVKEFIFNGYKGVVVTTSNTKSNYELAYDHNGRIVKIFSGGDANITADILINILETTTIAK